MQKKDMAVQSQFPAILAIATADPLLPRTFSGYASHLFSEIRSRGITVQPFASRELRWYDFLTGALNLSGFARGQLRGRRAPRIRPDWYWSRAGFERMNRRFNSKLANVPDSSIALQIGTHVRIERRRIQSYCVTDCTVVQALEGGEFSVGRASAHVAKEAITCQREVFTSCSKVFTLSRWAADSVVHDYGIASDRVAVVGAGANIPANSERRINRTDPYILFVGLDWEQKGGPLLLESFRLLRAQYPHVRLKVVGCSPSIAEQNVDIVGYLPHGDPAARRQLAELYSGAICLVLLSAFDCFGFVLLEAQLLGVPVVAIAGQGRPEALRHGETGFVVDRAEPKSVAEALGIVLTEELENGSLGAAARRWAENRFTWPLVVDRLFTEMEFIGFDGGPERAMPSQKHEEARN